MMIEPKRHGWVVGAALALGLLLLTSARGGAAISRCALDSQCAPRVCRQGVCRTPCSTDGECDTSQKEACVVGQCMPVFPVSYPIDWGLADGTRQPGCWNFADCNPGGGIFCNAPPGITPVCLTPIGFFSTCTAAGRAEAVDDLCPPFGGYRCNSPFGDLTCAAGPCTSNQQCRDAYPIAGLDCLEGRCTSLCTTDSDCCDAGKGMRCPAARAQNKCFHINNTASGYCVREIADTGRLIIYQLANRDPRPPARNLVLISEGFKANPSDPSDRTELDHFVNQALKHIQWQATRADMLAALLSTFNIFILELPDRFTGLGESTLFGHAGVNLDSTTVEYPGAIEQMRFVTRQALFSYASSLAPPLSPAPAPNDSFTTFHALLFNGGTDKRAHSNGSDMVLELITNDDGDPLAKNRGGIYAVLQHELGHALGGLSDEYDGEVRPSESPPTCTQNLVARTTVTDPPCEECSDSTFLPQNATWGEFVNTTTFPTTAGPVPNTVGLYAGGGRFFTLKAMRSQFDCMMREQGRLDYCTACREGLMRNVVGDGKSQSFRFLDMPNEIPAPTESGGGPNVAVAVDVDETRRHAYFTRQLADGGIALSDVDTDVLTRDGVTDTRLTDALDGAGIPHTITPLGQFVLLEGIHPSDPARSKVLVYDAAARTLGNPVSIPGLLGSPVRVSGVTTATAFAAYRRDPATGENQMAFTDVGAAGPLTPTFSVPTTRPGGMPRLEQAPVFASAVNRLFFPATKLTPAETFCDFNQCQIWAFDPESRQFVDPILTVGTSGVSDPGIVAMIVGEHVSGLPASLPGELLIAVTDNRISVWQTAQIMIGNTTPANSFSHSLGVTSLVTGVGFVPQTEQIVLTNRAGVVALFGVQGQNSPDGDRISIPDLKAGMQIRDLVVSPDGAAYLVAGGFSGPRAGLIATLDLTGNRTGADRVIFTQPVVAIGLARPSIAVDERHGVVYSNAVVESGDASGMDDLHHLRSPLVRGLHGHRFSPSGCPQ